MPDLGKYAFAVLGSYAATAVLIAGLVGLSLWQAARMKRALAEIEGRQEKADVKWLMVLPPVLFAGLAGLFYAGMYRDNPGELRSVFVGREAPALPATALPGIPGLTDADLRTGEVTVVNFWATWCPPCRAEHPVLLEMAADGVRVAGVNIRDDDEKAVAYLEEEGNPFLGVATDPAMRGAIDWGVTAPPETFIVAGDGTVLFRFVGPLVGTDYEDRFVPELEKALAGQ